MTFVDALRAVRGSSHIYRMNGPILFIDDLGQITLIGVHPLTLGDILDVDDWRISVRP